MIMEISHVGRTGKDTTINFDTERKIFCFTRYQKHDVYIYAERTGDVNSVVYALKGIGYKEVNIEEFVKGEN